MTDHPEAAAEFRTLFDEAPLAYQSLDPEGRFLAVNPAWCKLFGFEAQDVIGQAAVEWLAPASRELYPQRFSRLLTVGRVEGVEMEVFHADGTPLPVRLDGRVSRDADGTVLRTHCILRDLRPELAARSALEESERKYRRLVELAQEGIWQIDREGVTVFVNPAMCRMLGYREDEMLGRHFFEFMDEEARIHATRNLERRRAGMVEQHDFEFLARDGAKVKVTIETTPLFDEDGEYDGALAGIIDVTERRRLEQEMQHSQKLESLGVLAGGIAHDFNNLLQAILGNVDLARLDAADGADVGESLDEVEAAARRAAELCRQMLAYAGRSSLSPEVLDPGDLVRGMAEMVRSTVTRKADLRLNLATDLQPIQVDPVQMRQVVINLLTNASEALEGGAGRVELSLDMVTADARPHVRLRVRDTGCGMAPDVAVRAFEPFFTTRFTGRGLGLAAVRGIVQAHGGSVDLESRLNEGTTVTVLLPAAPEAVSPVDVSAAVDRDVERPHTALLADDEPGVLLLGVRMLERLGYRVITAVDGEEALVQFQTHREALGLVVLDLTMPGLDGAEVCARIRELDPSMPVVISSGYAAERVEELVRAHPPEAILSKPFRMEDLRRTLAAVVRLESE